ncbi:MAG: succinylglutamate desuccinylase/aspartoacylase family protein [Verrucomicrobiaceae bacterium]|nr:succinylglutamate desuccinylase/aspartoacylase family protein [Verrucomicrobiaceae bacterium]
MSLDSSWLSFEGQFAERVCQKLNAQSALPAPTPIFMQKAVSRPPKAGQGYKFGIFAGLHGDEEAGILATEELMRWASTHPRELADFELHFYPVCNPTGCSDKTRHSQAGLDLNRHFWCGSTEPEIVYLESELMREQFHGIVQLHSDDTSHGVYGFVSGSMLSELLLRPALQKAAEFLPFNYNEVIDGFQADQGIIRVCYEGILSAPATQRPKPLEIVFETPALAPIPQQVTATVEAVKTILAEYRKLQAYAADL